MRKNVLFLIGSLGDGGAEKVLIDTVNALDSNKYRITVQTVFDMGIRKKDLPESVRYKTILKTKSLLIRKLAAKILFFIMDMRVVYKIFVDEGYDYEIAFLEGLPTKILSESTNKKSRKYAWVHTDLNSFPDSYKAYGTEAKEEKAYLSFDKVFCVSEAVRKEFLKKYKINEEKITTLYNIVDDTSIVKASQEDVSLPTSIKPLFVTVGRLIKQKGYERLLRVHRKLINEGYSHALMIIGDGELRNTLADYINKNNLSQTAFMMGFQNNPHKYVSKADMFICSSIAEGYSTVVSEAVLSGIPVLSTDVAGAKEPIESPRCSIIIDNSDEALEEKLRYLLKNPHELMLLRSNIDTKQKMLRKDYLLKAFEEQVFS